MAPRSEAESLKVTPVMTATPFARAFSHLQILPFSLPPPHPHPHPIAFVNPAEGFYVKISAVIRPET